MGPENALRQIHWKLRRKIIFYDALMTHIREPSRNLNENVTARSIHFYILPLVLQGDREFSGTPNFRFIVFVREVK